jgi:hypothetical protein
MKKSSIAFFIIIYSSSISTIFSGQHSLCESEPVFARSSLRHIESNGIGYNMGYSTLDFFIAPSKDLHSFIPFLDARMHVFNNGQPALNAGVGMRYKSTSWVYGINSFYDYRKTHRFHYNQLGMGFEALSKKWDIRGNGYVPVGKLKSKNFQVQFDHFKDHFAILLSKREFAMYGAHLEAGYHIKDKKKLSLYSAAGPYFFYNQGENAAGGQVRFNAAFYDYIKLEFSGSYDPVFRWVGQGQAGLMITFGPKNCKKQKKQLSSSRNDLIRERSLQTVNRDEIVVLDRKKYKTIAKDPSTGNPWHFYFVNNTSNSLGTAESPFPTLAMAQAAAQPGNIIYVYQGSGSAYDVGALGFYLESNQKLWGSGVEQVLLTTLGEVKIKQQSTLMPILTAGGGGVGIVNLANNNEVSGIHFFGNAATGYGILGGDPLEIPLDSSKSIAKANLHNNYFDGNFINNPVRCIGKGDVNIFQNEIRAAVGDDYAAILVSSIGTDSLYSKIYSNNIEPSLNKVSGIQVNASNASQHFSQVGNNTIVSTSQNNNAVGISLGSSNTSSLEATIFLNDIQVYAQNQGWGVLCGLSDQSIMNVLLKDNNARVQSVTNGASAYAFAVSQGTTLFTTLQNNKMSVKGGADWSYGIYVQNNGGAATVNACNALFTGNTGTVSGVNPHSIFINPPFIVTEYGNDIEVE